MVIITEFKMKVAVLVLAIFGSAFAASIKNDVEIPPFRHMELDPIRPSEEISHRPTLRIVNGREVVPHSINYQAYLVARSSSGAWSCGGSLITNRYVLTAAHCVDGARSIQITLGTHNLRTAASGQITVDASTWTMHPRYNSRTIDNDVAVIRLVSNVGLTRNIGLSRLPRRSDVGVNLVGRNGRVSGWGLTSGSGTGSNVLLAVNNTVISNVECNSYYGVVRNEEICLSGAGGRTACNGDSGGPMVVGNKQVGIVSYGSRGCPAGTPSVYVRVTKFLDWIQNNSDWRAS